MLTQSSRRYSTDEDIDFIHNYYERLVLQEILQQSVRVQAGDRDFMADVACVALNRLPPRYIRHNVDMTFFMSPQEMQEIESKVTNTVALALTYVESREFGAHSELPVEQISKLDTKLANNKTAPGKNKKTAAVKGPEKKSKK
jgi:hypothetical protein